MVEKLRFVTYVRWRTDHELGRHYSGYIGWAKALPNA